MQEAKVRSYIGFAIKARKIIYGLDNILTSKKRPYLLLIDKGFSPNSQKKLARYAEENEIPIMSFNLETVIPDRNCKAVGLMEKNLAAAVLKELKESL